MAKVVIIEDEKDLVLTLQNMITLIAPDLEIAGTADSIDTAVELIEKTKPNIAFFDVEIKGGLSFEIIKQLGNISFQLIFITAHSSYAVNAFQYSAIDYLVKPVDPEALERAIIKAKKSIQNTFISEKAKNLVHNLNLKTKEQKIILQTTESAYITKISDIIRCEADNNYTKIFLQNGEIILISKPLKEYESLLPKTMFFRVHQSHIVNFEAINQINKKSLKVLLSNGEKIPLAVRRREELFQAMKTYCQ